MIIKINEHFCGRTIKSVLAELKFSAKTVTGLKRLEDGILVNGEHKTVRYILEEGDILSLMVEDTSSSHIIPKALHIDLIYEDDWLLFVNKPPRLPVHPTRHHQDDTLAARIAYYYSDRPFVFRCITRLDADTSGAVMIAKDRITACLMSDMIAKRQIKKEYIAVCAGVTAQKGDIDFNIRRPNPMNIKREAVPQGDDCSENSPQGAVAFTSYELLCSSKDHSLLKVAPQTGRTHQIRVHLSAAGNPILGDFLYGERSELIDRHALHAMSLEFIHPHTGETLKISAPLFEDMKSLIDALFSDSGGKEILFDKETGI